MSDAPSTNTSNGGEASAERTQHTPSPPSYDGGSNDLSGTNIGGYRLVRKLAAGGMGVVYEAIQTKLDRKVALKVLTEQLDARPEFLQRFEREAKAAASLNHPNMVQVFDYGEATGRHYIIMEFVEGENLSSYTFNREKLSVDEALYFVEQAAHALRAAAQKSIIHRDIKPSNLLLTPDGHVKVADLGLAKILSQDSELTLSSVSIGSPHFIAPEQAEDSRGADHRADIYSLGVTLLFLLTGKYAYDGDSPISIVIAHTTKPLPTGAELGTALPQEVEDLIHRMAAKDPNDRYQDYDSLIMDLQRVRAGLAPEAPVGRNKLRHSQIILAATVVGCVAVIAAATVIAIKWKSKTPAATKITAVTSQPVASPETTVTPVATQTEPRPEDVRRGRPPEFASEGQQRPFPPDDNGQFGGPGRERPGGPMGGMPVHEFYDVPKGPPAEMLAKADQYAEQHSSAYEEVLDAYRQVRDRAVGTPVETEVRKRLDEWTSQREAALKEALQTREAKMQQLLREGKQQEALSVWADFPNGLRNRESDDQIREIIRRSLGPNFRPQR